MSEKNKLYVDLGADSYEILLEASFDGLAAALKKIDAPAKLLIVTDTNVDRLYADEVSGLLEAAGYDVKKHVFPAGEENKHMDTILSICRACLEHRMDRKSMIIALGGGVVGDMAGFAAAIYMRGIRFVQVPTTLLSQSDSSVGGKTGIDFMDGKNILGAFHQPKLVYINVDVLKTLPKREFISGMGEVIKHGIIRNREFFDYLKENKAQICAMDHRVLIDMVRENCAVKADVVMQDEKETGLRAILNFGHTFGHGVESAFHFSMTHGECVGIGMNMAAGLAKKRGLISPEEYAKIRGILELYEFPLNEPLPETEEILSFMMKDKKADQGTLKFILPDRIGHVIQAADITKEEIIETIKTIQSKETI